MRSFFLFLYNYRAFLVFTILQSVAFFLVVKNSNYNSATFFNSTNAVVGSLLETSSEAHDFLSLVESNKKLNIENANLRAKYYALESQLAENNLVDTIGKYSFINSKIIKNSVFLLNNTLTINSGSDQGVKRGMGVIGSQGIVGKVKRVGNQYSTVVSLLDVDVKVSAEILNKIKLCTVQWDGKWSNRAKVLYVPRHYKLAIGDSVVTSGNNAVFPPGVAIGIISQLNLPEEATFYDIEIELINDFNSLSLVEVVINKDLPQIDSLIITAEE